METEDKKLNLDRTQKEYEKKNKKLDDKRDILNNREFQIKESTNELNKKTIDIMEKFEEENRNIQESREANMEKMEKIAITAVNLKDSQDKKMNFVIRVSKPKSPGGIFIYIYYYNCSRLTCIIHGICNHVVLEYMCIFAYYISLS